MSGGRSGSTADTTTAPQAVVDSRMMFAGNSSLMQVPGIRLAMTWCVQVPTVADQLPSTFRTILTSGPLSVVVFFAVYLTFVLIWLPFWLMTFLLTENGVYLLTLASLFFLGRCVIRLIAFPGASTRVVSEIEGEFAKYSVRMLLASATCLRDLATAILSTTSSSASENFPLETLRSPGHFTSYEIPGLWKRSKSYKDRALGVFLEVLLYIFENRAQNPLVSQQQQQRPGGYCMNPLSGDIGNLAGLTPQARDDGRELAKLLKKVLDNLNELEQANNGGSGNQSNTEHLRSCAWNLLVSASELRDFVSGLKPPEDKDNGGEEEELSVDAVRRSIEEQSNGSTMETVKSGLAWILPLLDPPPHTSIFGLDVLRGTLLSKYRGARQFWVRRPSGGMIDVVHIPARRRGALGEQRISHAPNPKAVLYCNPNAGLFEVATGMSLAGGNVWQDDNMNSSNDSCWTDIYTEEGFDMYLFNYAGFGRSFGVSRFGAANGEVYTPGIVSRLRRIFRSSFVAFKPTPDSLREDGVAVANFLVSEAGVESLVIHGESIGGMAASRSAHQLCLSPATSRKVSLLICDRTFCNLEAVAQRLVGFWSGYAIRALAPLWNTDVTGDFIQVSCPKVVANDFADVIIADPSSLKTGVSLWREVHRGATSTRRIGWEMEVPVEYRMADWENVSVNDSQYIMSGGARTCSPVWPQDKHISLDEAFHFAACVKRIGKLAKVEVDRTLRSADEEQGSELVRSSSPIYLAWEALSCCDGLCGAPLGYSVKRGDGFTFSWLCSCLTYGGQAVAEAAERRLKVGGANQGVTVTPADFGGRQQALAKQESTRALHPKPIPEVVACLKALLEQNNEESVRSIKHELKFVVGLLQYIVDRLSSPIVVESSLKRLHLQREESMVGTFLPLHCGHNSPYSQLERQNLIEILRKATSVRSSS